MNKLPINERAIIKDVLSQINAANLADKLEKLKLEQLNRQHHQRILKQASDSAKAEVEAEFKAKAIGIMCMGTLAYVGLTLITR
jgi:preprotein translocase subunit Sss1